MSMFGTKNNGKLSTIQKSLIRSVVGFTCSTCMAIIAHSTLWTSDLPRECSLWILQLFQEAWPKLMLMIIIKELLKNCGSSWVTSSVMSLAWVLHFHFCLGWSGVKLFFHQEQTCIFKALWIRTVESCFLLCPKVFDSH